MSNTRAFCGVFAALIWLAQTDEATAAPSADNPQQPLTASPFEAEKLARLALVTSSPRETADITALLRLSHSHGLTESLHIQTTHDATWSSVTWQQTAAARFHQDPQLHGLLWLDLQQDGHSILWAARRGDNNVYSRTIVHGPLHKATTREQLANIISAAARALAQGDQPENTAQAPATSVLQQTLQPDVQKAPSSPPKPAPKRAESFSPWLQLQVGYSGHTFAGAAKWQSAASLAAAIYIVPQAYLGLGYDVTFPSIALGSYTAKYNVFRHPVFAMGGYQLATPNPRLRLVFEGRFVADILTNKPYGVNDAPVRKRVFLSLEPRIGLRVRLIPQLHLSLWAGVDIMLLRNRYVYDSDTQMSPDGVTTPGTTVLLDPFPARFSMGLRFEVDLVGRRRGQRNQK